MALLTDQRVRIARLIDVWKSRVLLHVPKTTYAHWSWIWKAPNLRAAEYLQRVPCAWLLAVMVRCRFSAFSAKPSTVLSMWAPSYCCYGHAREPLTAFASPSKRTSELHTPTPHAQKKDEDSVEDFGRFPTRNSDQIAMHHSKYVFTVLLPVASSSFSTRQRVPRTRWADRNRKRCAGRKNPTSPVYI